MQIKQCDQCLEAATLHVTELLPGTFAELHFCGDHEPREYKQAIYSLFRASFDNLGTRDATVSWIASQLGGDRSRVLQALSDGLARLKPESD